MLSQLFYAVFEYAHRLML